MKESFIGRSRAVTVIILFVVVFGLYSFRLLYLQVLNADYRELAGDRIRRREVIYPERGLIYDRNGVLVVYNEPVYNLMVTPNQVSAMDTARFCELFRIERETFVKQLDKAKRYSWRKPSLFIKEIKAADYAAAEEYLYQFPGFFPEVRTIRRYPHKSGAHVLGYVGEVDSSDIRKSEGYYRAGDHIGRTGVEQTYESVLRGERGVRHVLVDQFNRSAGAYRGGIWDTAATRGQDLTLTLDIVLQQYGELLMQNKKGSIVAIEPSTGEILALVSSPAYDPNLLVGRERSRNFHELRTSGTDPINNRALKGYYPPGSTYKPLMALFALQDSVIHPNFFYACGGGYRLGGLRVGCHAHPSSGTVQAAIQTSCNAYFCASFKLFMDQPGYAKQADAFQHWRDYMLLFGLGDRVGIDIPGEIRGNIPTVADYDRAYNKGAWKASTIITLGIGQDKMITTPLQQANMMAAISNGGWWYSPHVVKQVESTDSVLAPYRVRHESGFRPEIFDVVREGLAMVVSGGTGRQAQVPGVLVGGKTGTAENPIGEDHSLFIAFAPVDNPQIAIAAIVENSGWGGSWSGPICGLMIEKYLKREITDPVQLAKEKRMLEGNFLSPKPVLMPVVPGLPVPVPAPAPSPAPPAADAILPSGSERATAHLNPFPR